MSLSDVMSLILMHHNWNYNDALEWKTFGLPKIFVTAFFMACVEISKNKRGGGGNFSSAYKAFHNSRSEVIRSY